MRLPALLHWVAQELRRTGGALAGAGFGIAVGTAALAFFLGLGLGARAVLLGQVFPIDRIELLPQRGEAGLLALLGGYEPAGVNDAAVAELRAVPGVTAVYPKLRFRFPSMARGGREILGQEIGTHEMMGDGVDPALVEEALRPRFFDPLSAPEPMSPQASSAHPGPPPTSPQASSAPPGGPPCAADADCPAEQYCELPSGAPRGTCSAPVPALVSRYLVEVFDHGVAPAHGLPPVASTLLARVEGVPFTMTLGTSLLGKASQGVERRARLRVIGVSPRAIDLGVTLPLGVVQRWNREYSGSRAAEQASSVVVQTADASAAAAVLSRAAALALVPADTRARDVSVLVTAVLALLTLVAGTILLVAALNIAHTFRALVEQRRAELALFRALGASQRDVVAFLALLALAVGLLGGLTGCAVARALAAVTDWRAAVDLPDFPFKPGTFFAFPPALWAASVGVAMAAAVLGALRPALSAARADPAAGLQR